MPMAGIAPESDLRRFSGLRTVADPYTGQEWVAVPAIRPDWAILHVHEADEEGNVRIRGAKYDDIVKAKAAAHVLITCERLLAPGETAAHPELTDLPGFLVDAVSVVPRGAWPHSCEGLYGPDEQFLADYLAACQAPDTYDAFVRARVLSRSEVL
jgi:glutaconate CoA-transferase, subunit A